MSSVLILGATSHIAKALISENAKHRKWVLALAARQPNRVLKFLERVAPGESCQVLPLTDITMLRGNPDVVINCIGLGTPAKQRGAGFELFATTEAADQLALGCLERYPKAKLISFSSGAVYGNALSGPMVPGFTPSLEVSPLKEADFYRITKIYQEAKHRALPSRWILDIRLFSFFSQFVDPDAGFFLTDVIAALRTDIALSTDENDFYRDYIAPSDLYRFLCWAMEQAFINGAFDAFSAAPISKSEALTLFQREFGLKVERKNSVSASPSGDKQHYYSTQKASFEARGFVPQKTSWDSISQVFIELGISKRAT